MPVAAQQPRETPPPAPNERDAATVLAEMDAELPSRRLTGRVLALVNPRGFAIALFVLHQVFRPLAAGNQYYLVLFLAGVLPLALLSYRGRRRSDAAAGASHQPDASDQPGAADWEFLVRHPWLRSSSWLSVDASWVGKAERAMRSSSWSRR